MSKILDLQSDKFPDLAAAGLKALAKTMQLISTDFWGNLREEAPVDEGRLAGSFGLIKEDNFTYKITNNTEYLLPVLEGARPHRIEAHGRALRFQAGGNVVFVRFVNHPGNKPNDFVGRAEKRTRARVDEFIDRGIREAIP